MKIIIVEPHGFCSGVARALKIIQDTLEKFPGEPLFCLHEIVHNEHVVNELCAAGTKFVDTLDDVPCFSRILFSAHGISPEIRRIAEKRNLEVIDATCPFVEKVHQEVRRFAEAGKTIVCIGHKGHDEIIGVAGEAPGKTYVVESADDAMNLSLPRETPIAVVSQTTISSEMYNSVLAVLQNRFSNCELPAKTDICYATRNRQEAVRALAEKSAHILVLGSKTSSNSKRLVETARLTGCDAALIGNLNDLENFPADFDKTLGITSGASTPESFLDSVLSHLKKRNHVATVERLNYKDLQ